MINENEFFCRGSLNLFYLTSKMRKLFPSVINNCYQEKFIKLVADLEAHPDYFHLAPPLFNSNFRPFTLTEVDTNPPIEAAIGGLLARPPPLQPGQPPPQDCTLSWNAASLAQVKQSLKTQFTSSIKSRETSFATLSKPHPA